MTGIMGFGYICAGEYETGLNYQLDADAVTVTVDVREIKEIPGNNKKKKKVKGKK